MEARSADVVIFKKEGKGAPQRVVQPLTPATADLMRSDVPLKVRLRLEGLRGVTDEAHTSLIVQRDTLATELERLTLTLFEISSDKVTPIAEEQIKKFVAGIPEGSVVIVRGYADMLGNAEFNRRLSQQRANAVCSAIKKYIERRIDLQCTDIATDRFPPGIESYATPEERFLSRTVQIEIKKKR